MKLVLATQNPKKLKEMNEILRHLGVEVVSEAELGVRIEVEETGDTFTDNARLKATAVMQATGLPARAGRLRPLRGRAQRRTRCVFRPVWRRGAGRSRPVYPAAAKPPGADHAGGAFYLRHCLRLPQRRYHHR